MVATSPSPRRSQTFMSYQTSPTHRSSKRAFSAAASPRNIGPKEKRARRGATSTFPKSSPTIPSKSFNALSFAPSPLTTLFTNHTSSAPPTPLLPSSSSSFFLAVSSSTGHNGSQMQPSLPPSPRHSPAMLDDLYREAFTNLRQSLAQSGECFLRRMRDWEERRNTERNLASMVGVQELRRDKRRSRKRKTSLMDDHTAGGMSKSPLLDSISSFPVHVSHMDRDPGSILSYGTFFSTRDDSDIGDDMLVDNVGHSLSLAPSERKPRNGSTRRPPIGLPYCQQPFAVDLAEPDTEHFPSAHYTSTFDFSFTNSNTRSSSPFSLGNTSDDESSYGSRYDQCHSGFSSPSAMSRSSPVNWSSHTIFQRNQPRKPGESVLHSSPGASPCPTSPGFSHSLLATQRHMAVKFLDDTSTHMHPHPVAVPEMRSEVPQTTADNALAALVLSLGNGSGSLADYGYVREAQGELQELEAGGLWE